MKSSRKNFTVRDAGAIARVNPELECIPQEDASDAVCALLQRVAERGNHKSTDFSYWEDLKEVDYIDEQALHRIVEDLQFGHDLRL